MPRWLNFPLMAPSLSLPQKSAPIAGNARFTESGEVNLSSPGIPIAAWSGESILAFMSASGSIWKTTLSFACGVTESVPCQVPVMSFCALTMNGQSAVKAMMMFLWIIVFHPCIRILIMSSVYGMMLIRMSGVSPGWDVCIWQGLWFWPHS